MSDLFHHIIIIFIGISVILVCAHYVVQRSIDIAQRFDLTDEFIGMTILSVGTSLPELVTQLAASYKILKEPQKINEISALAVGANIGSDIFQQNFLLGFVALLGSLTVLRKDLNKDMGGLIIAAFILWLFTIGGVIGRFEGALLVFCYLGYIYVLKIYGRAVSEIRPYRYGTLKNVVVITASFILMAIAGVKVLDSSEVIVERTLMSYSFFGIVILGVASAMPEFATSIISIFKRRGSISAGILIGSNITNPTFALGLGAMLSTYTVPNVVIVYDLPLKILTGIMIYLMFKRNETLRKRYALFLILIFIGYILFRQMYFPSDY